MKIINIGIVAHVDAGKTTLTENILFESGAIKEKDQVDLSNTVTDNLEMERKRGITIKETTVSFLWNGVKINILDTPGHADFFAEVARSMQVLDAAILVISAKEGIQSQTVTIFNSLKKLNIPIIIFINKLDRAGADVKSVCKNIDRILGAKFVMMQYVKSNENNLLILGKWYEDLNTIEDNLLTLSDFNSALIDDYAVNPQDTLSTTSNLIVKQMNSCKVIPVFLGSAIKDIGVRELIDGVVQMVIPKKSNDINSLSAVIYKIVIDEHKNKKIYFRIYHGEVRLRETIIFKRDGRKVTVGILEKLSNTKIVKTDVVEEGDIGILTNIPDVKVGDIIGESCQNIKMIPEIRPIITSTIAPIDVDKRYALIDALFEMTEEDPSLACEIDKKTSEIKVDLFGEIQKEFIKFQLKDRYGIDAEFLNTITIFKEMPLTYSEFAINMGQDGNIYNASIKLVIEPLPVGSGIEYESCISYGYLNKSFQNAVYDGVRKGLEHGIYGWEVTDIKVTLSSAYYDSVSSTPADFRNLAPIVLHKALLSAGTILLEPILHFEILISNELCGKVISDIESMRGNIYKIEKIGGNLKLFGKVPLETSKTYSIKLASYTKGRGIFSVDKVTYDKYEGSMVNENNYAQ